LQRYFAQPVPPIAHVRTDQVHDEHSHMTGAHP
jgi:hypothetical protein